MACSTSSSVVIASKVALSGGEAHHSSLIALWRKERLTDIAVCAEGTEFKVHRAALAAASGYFLSLFESGMRDAASPTHLLEGIHSPVLEALLAFLYEGSCEVEAGLLTEMLDAAARLAVDPLKAACAVAIQSQLAPRNALDVWRLADLYTLPALEKVAVEAALRGFEELPPRSATGAQVLALVQAGFEAAALLVLDQIGAEELARRHTQAQAQPSTARFMERFEARTKAAVSKAQDAADLASRKERQAERVIKALERDLAERVLKAYEDQRFGPDDAGGKAKEAEAANVDDAVQGGHQGAEAAPSGAAAGAGATHGDDAGGAVEVNEGGDQTGGGQCGGDQCGGDQSGADESSGASDEAAGGGTAALRRQLAECKLQLEQVCAEAGSGAPLTLPHTGPYTPYLSSHRRAVCVEVERGAPFTPLTSHAHPLPSAHTLTSPCTPYAPCTPHAPLL